MAPLFKRRDSSNLTALAKDPNVTIISNTPPAQPTTVTPNRSKRNSLSGSIDSSSEAERKTGSGIIRKSSLLLKRLGISNKDHSADGLRPSSSSSSLNSFKSKPPPSPSASANVTPSQRPTSQLPAADDSSDSESDSSANGVGLIGRKSLDTTSAPAASSLIREDIEPSPTSPVRQISSPPAQVVSSPQSQTSKADRRRSNMGESVWSYQSSDEEDSAEDDDEEGFATPDEGLSEVGEESEGDEPHVVQPVVAPNSVIPAQPLPVPATPKAVSPKPTTVQSATAKPVLPTPEPTTVGPAKEVPMSLVDTSQPTDSKALDRVFHPIPTVLPVLHEKDQDRVLKEDLRTCHKVMNLFLASHIKEAERIVYESDPKRERLYLQIADCILSTLKGIMTFEPADLQHAQIVTRYVTDLVTSYRKPASSIGSRLSGFVRGSGGSIALMKSMTDVEKHAELIYAETLLMKSMLGILVGGEWMALIREAMNMRTSQGIYRSLNSFLEAADKAHPQGYDPSIDRDLRSGIELGTGMSALIMSLMPGKVVKVAEVFGFQGSRRYALDKLAESGGWTADSDRPAILKDREGVRRPLSDMSIMLFHLVISSLIPVTDVDVKFGEKVMWYNVERFPNGVFSLFFQARLHVIQDQPHKSSEVLFKAMDAQADYIQLQLLSRWDIGTNALALNEFEFAAECFEKLYSGSNWSKATYLYSTAAALCETDEVDIKLVIEYMRDVPKNIKKVVGKSLPVEKFVSRKSRKFLSQGRLALPGVELSYVFGLFHHTPVWSFQQKTLPRIQIVIDELEASTPETYKGGVGYWDDFALAHLLKGVALGLIGLPNPDRVVSADDPSAEPVDEAQLAIDAMTELRLVLEHGRKLVLDHWIVFFTHYEIGSLYQRQGKFQDALRHYQLVLSGKPTEADLHKITGKYSLQNGVTLKCTAAIQVIKEKQKAH